MADASYIPIRGTFRKGKDVIQWRIEEDGTVTLITDGVSGENHTSADKLFDTIESLAGNKRQTKERKKHVHRTHTHSHDVGQHHHH